MRKRFLAFGTMLLLSLAFGTLSMSGVALAGEDDDSSDDSPQVTETTPAPVPVTPAPQPVAAPSPAPSPAPAAQVKNTKSTSRHGSSNTTPSGSISPQTQPVAVTTSQHDSGVVPQGGIQAGGGGTSGNGLPALAVALALGTLAFGLASGGIALRRRSAER